MAEATGSGPRGGRRGGGRGGDRYGEGAEGAGEGAERRGGGRGRGRRERAGAAGGRAPREESRLQETVVKVMRNAKVVKGGRRFTFGALVVVGDGRGQVGIGHGKANGVPDAVEKGVKQAQKELMRVPLVHAGTIPHQVIGRFGSTKVYLIPAAPGTGVKAGAAVKAVLVAAGVENILTKVHGSTNPVNVLKATCRALRALRTREEVAALRGVELARYAWPPPPEAVVAAG